MPCTNATNITLSLSTPVLCSSVARDGSDFAINAPVSITGAQGINCAGDSGYTSTIVIHFSSALPVGDYTLSAQNGTDGNTLLNLCNNALSLPNSIAFTILTSGKQVTVNQTICSKQLPYIWNGITVTGGGEHAAEYTTTSAEGCDSTTILNLTVLSSSVETVTADQYICYGELPYTWNGITVTEGGEHVAEYTTASAAGCDSTTILNLYVGDPPAHISSTATICAYESYRLPWDSTVTTAGTYTHTYINSAGCDSLTEQITLVDSACKNYVFIPTAFTPNTDSKNDIFKPIVLGNVTNYRFTVYNRWGKEIFSSTDVLHGWDGTVNGIQQPQGTFVWVCTFQLPNQSLQTQRGTVVLLR
jgi:gliding motility-associated-like protein